jgi:phosphatidylserine/phosphatidylglycerophosphate/cardiolipin synthase-like enzyme
MATAFSEARNSLFIASAFASRGKLEILRAQFEAALKRGVSVDVLWGYMTDGTEDGRELVEWLRRLAYDVRRDSKDMLRFNRMRSGSHGKLLLWDGPSGVTACIGSYNWLSAIERATKPPISSNVTMRTSEPAVAAAFARCAAALWSGVESEVLSSAGDRWRRIAADLDMAASRTDPRPTNANVRLVLDREHEVLLGEWVRTAQARLLIASHRLGPASEIRLVSADVLRPSSFVLDVLYGYSDIDDAQLARVSELVRKGGGVLKHVPGLHTKVVVSDASACVTSYNFLSADPFGTARNARELGLVIDGKEPADWLWNQLHG